MNYRKEFKKSLSYYLLKVLTGALPLPEDAGAEEGVLLGCELG